MNELPRVTWSYHELPAEQKRLNLSYNHTMRFIGYDSIKTR